MGCRVEDLLQVVQYQQLLPPDQSLLDRQD